MYRNPCIYQEVGTRTEAPEPVPWNRRKQGFSTETGTKLKIQYRPNTIDYMYLHHDVVVDEIVFTSSINSNMPSSKILTFNTYKYAQGGLVRKYPHGWAQV